MRKPSKMARFENEIEKILILIAMEAEAKPLLDTLKLNLLSTDIPNAPFHLYQGIYKSKQISLVTNGKDKKHNVDNVGTTSAALSAFLAINHVKPDILINAGTAGGFKRVNANIGDAFISTICLHHDRRIPIPGFKEYGIGNHESISCLNMIEKLNLKSGVVSTSNSLDHTEMDDKMMLENNASVKDMEAAAIAYIAEITNTPFFALKVVTDIVDGDRVTQDEFFENLAAAATSLQEKIPLIVDFIVGKKLCEL